MFSDALGDSGIEPDALRVFKCGPLLSSLSSNSWLTASYKSSHAPVPLYTCSALGAFSSTLLAGLDILLPFYADSSY